MYVAVVIPALVLMKILGQWPSYNRTWLIGNSNSDEDAKSGVESYTEVAIFLLRDLFIYFCSHYKKNVCSDAIKSNQL
jgi:hypothetical protein